MNKRNAKAIELDALIARLAAECKLDAPARKADGLLPAALRPH